MTKSAVMGLLREAAGPSPPAMGLGSAVSSPAGSGTHPHPKLNLAHISRKLGRLQMTNND